MPGDRSIFAEAIKRGNQYVWDKAWSKAIAEYETALEEFPDDPIALASAGFVYTQLKRLDDALRAYRSANRSQPNDPAIVSRLAEVEERLGLAADATRTFLALGELYSGRQKPDKAIQYWERAAKLEPNNIEVHKHLAVVYETMGKDDLAAREHATLAKIYQESGQMDLAVAASQTALALAPRQTGVLRALGEIDNKAAPVTPSLPSVPRPAAPAAVPGPAPAPTFSWDIDLTVDETPEAEGKGSPLEIARDKAMSDLAETLFEDVAALQPRVDARGPAARLNKAEVDALIGQALDFQRRGQISQAIDAYYRILEAFDMPAAHFNLGLLYMQDLRFDEAVEQFSQIADHPDYTLGSHFALGECYRVMKQPAEALKQFLDVLKFADLQMAQREQAEALIALYDDAAETYTTGGNQEETIKFTSLLIEFLSSPDWEGRVTEARKHMDSVAGEGGPILSLLDLFTVPNAEMVLRSFATSQEYAKQGRYYIAADELYNAIAKAPDYLPLHLRLAELLWNEGYSEPAILKLRTIADTYQVRGDIHHSMDIYQRILHMTPMDIPTRTTLIDLLVGHGAVDTALDQYMQLADTYYQLAQIDKARETYQEALTHAHRGSTTRLWMPKIYSHLGDIDMQRIDWRRAIQAYEQVKAYTPDDEKARHALIDLYYKIGQNQRAVRELDELLTLYRAADNTDKMIAVMEDQVHMRPNEIPLRTRLAGLYVESGKKEQAIEQLDVLGELQLQAGLRKEAAMTIRGIIALGPSNVDDYKQLLVQIGTSLLGPSRFET